MAGECYCVALRKAARKVTSLYDAALEPTGVNLAQFSLLRTIERQQSLRRELIEPLRNARLVLSWEQLMERVWGIDFDAETHVLEVYVGYLRAKL